MIIAPLVPIDLCGGRLAPNEIHAGCSRRLVSPDGRWQVVIRGEDGLAPNVRLNRPLRKDEAVVADRAGHVIATFEMARDACLH